MPPFDGRAGRTGGLPVAAITSVTLAVVTASSCAPSLSLDDRRCPCTADYHCCDGVDTCRPNGVACPVDQGAGGAPSRPDSGSGGVKPQGHDAGAGTGGVVPPPRPDSGSTDGEDPAADGAVSPPGWRSIDSAGLGAYEVRDQCDLELAADGTPFVAFRACKGCPSQFSSAPTVLALTGARWTALSQQGLPATSRPASLVVGAGATPHVLVDDAVRSLDGVVWRDLGFPVPGVVTADRNFDIDASGRFYVTTYDASKFELSLLRFDGAAWIPVGAAEGSDPSGERLAVTGDAPWLAHTRGRVALSVDMKLRVLRFDGTTWNAAEILDAAPFEFAVAPDGTVYVARQAFSPGPSIVTARRNGVTTEISTVSTIGTPSLRVGPDGDLYAAYLSDGFVNLSRWNGSAWTNFDVDGLGAASSVPVIRIAKRSGLVVPFLCYTRGTTLVVMKYE